MTRILSRMALLAIASLALAALLACGSSDEDGDGASSGNATSTPVATDGLEARISDDGSLTLRLPPAELDDIDADLAITASGDSWDLAPDGATFDDSVFVVFTWPRTGDGIPVAVVETSDGTRELPLQTVDLHDGSATFVVLLTHFSNLSVEELADVGDGDEALLAGGDDDDAPGSLDDFDPIDGGDGGGAAIDQRIGALTTAREAGPSPALALPSGPILATPISVTGDEQGDFGLMIQPVNDKLAAMFSYQSAAPSGPAKADNADGGGAEDFLANARPVPTISDDLGTAVDISESTQYAFTDGGIILAVDITDVPPAPTGGEIRVFATADAPGVFIESRTSTNPEVSDQVTVFDRSTFAAQDRDEDPEKGEIQGLGDALVVLFFPLNFPDRTPVATVNDTDYELSGLRVDVITRDADGQPIFEGATRIDLSIVVDHWLASAGD